MRRFWSRTAIVSLLHGSGLFFPGALLTSVARADVPQPPSWSFLDEDHDWPAGSVQTQLDRDVTLVPYGKGAIFVPAMTNPLDEPPIAVFSGETKVAESTTGRRIVLSPGTYDVRLGSGAVEQRVSVQASVREQYTTVVPVSWAGLSIHVVDEQFNNLRASYEIIRVRGREYMGMGFGTDEQAGEPITTWVLAPGLYKIVRTGENYRARRDFATVRLVEGKHTHFLLVLDPETGEFRGGGEVPAEDLFRPQKGFFANLIIGGDLAFTSRTNAPVAGQEGLSFQFRGFLDHRLSIEVFGHPLVVQLQVEEGQTKVGDQPFQKINDRVDLDLLYIYRWKNWLGPYVRFGAETNLFPTIRNFENPEVVELRRVGGQPDEILPPSDSVQVSPSAGLISLKEGGGLNLRLFRAVFAEVNVRTGLGGRHRLTRDLFVETRGPGDGNVILTEVDSDNQVGVETTVLAVARITRWIILNLEVDTLVPFTSFEETLIDLEASVALKLTRFLSVRWAARFVRDRAIQPEDRYENDVLLRFSVELL